LSLLDRMRRDSPSESGETESRNSDEWLVSDRPLVVGVDACLPVRRHPFFGLRTQSRAEQRWRLDPSILQQRSGGWYKTLQTLLQSNASTPQSPRPRARTWSVRVKKGLLGLGFTLEPRALSAARDGPCAWRRRRMVANTETGQLRICSAQALAYPFFSI
jgi:hypothetical protein